jgi:hypothetical protein
VTARWFPTEITDEEVDFGSIIMDAGKRTLAVADMGRGLRAVKARGPGGKAQYLVCNEELAPLYPAAKSLEELRTRFPSR